MDGDWTEQWTFWPNQPGITERAMDGDRTGFVSTVLPRRERLIDKLMTKVLRHDIKDQYVPPACLHSHVCRIDEKNLRPTVAEVAWIASTSTKHVGGEIVRNYDIDDDETGFWIGLDYSSEVAHLHKHAGRKRKRKRKAAHDDS